MTAFVDNFGCHVFDRRIAEDDENPAVKHDRYVDALQSCSWYVHKPAKKLTGLNIFFGINRAD